MTTNIDAFVTSRLAISPIVVKFLYVQLKWNKVLSYPSNRRLGHSSLVIKDTTTTVLT